MKILPVNQKLLNDFLKRAISEDSPSGDVTSRSVFQKGFSAESYIIAKEKGVMAGLEILKPLGRLVDKKLSIVLKVKDGAKVQPGEKVAIIKGSIYSILFLERIALNLIGRLSGIASLTAKYVSAVKKKDVAILDTRKTTPNSRFLERYAVRCGGGVNHREGLSDQVLIKDNHLWARACHSKRKETLDRVVRDVRASIPKKMILEIEVDTLNQFKEVLLGEPDIVLLDNMSNVQMKKAVSIAKDFSQKFNLKRPLLEASGGITLKRVPSISMTGIDRISVGALTHSANNFDVSLEIYKS